MKGGDGRRFVSFSSTPLTQPGTRRHRLLGDAARGFLVQHYDIPGALQLPGRGVEVLRGSDGLAGGLNQGGGEARAIGVGGGLEGRLHRAVLRRLEPLALLFPLHQQTQGGALNPAGAQLPPDLLPQHRGERVAEQAVEDTAGFLGTDELLIHLARFGERGLDGAAGDFVECDALHRNARLQDLDQVPADGLALAVFIGGQDEFVRLPGLPAKSGDVFLRFPGDHIDGLKVSFGIDAQTSPRLRAQGRRDFARRPGQVTNVPEACLNFVALAQKALDGGGLRGRFDDDELHGWSSGVLVVAQVAGLWLRATRAIRLASVVTETPSLSSVNRARTVVRLPPGEQAAGLPDGLVHIQKRSRDALCARSLRRRFGRDLEPDGQGLPGQVLHLARLGCPATAGGEDDALAAKQALGHARLHGPEPRFPDPGEDVRDLLPALAPDLLVEVDELPLQQASHLSSHRGLAAGHEADQEDA